MKNIFGNSLSLAENFGYVSKMLKERPISCGHHKRIALAVCIDCVEDFVQQALDDERGRILAALEDEDFWPTDGCEEEMRPRIEKLVRG